MKTEAYVDKSLGKRGEGEFSADLSELNPSLAIAAAWNTMFFVVVPINVFNVLSPSEMVIVHGNA